MIYVSLRHSCHGEGKRYKCCPNRSSTEEEGEDVTGAGPRCPGTTIKNVNYTINLGLKPVNHNNKKSLVSKKFSSSQKEPDLFICQVYSHSHELT